MRLSGSREASIAEGLRAKAGRSSGERKVEAEAESGRSRRKRRAEGRGGSGERKVEAEAESGKVMLLRAGGRPCARSPQAESRVWWEVSYAPRSGSTFAEAPSSASFGRSSLHRGERSGR